MTEKGIAVRKAAFSKVVPYRVGALEAYHHANADNRDVDSWTYEEGPG